MLLLDPPILEHDRARSERWPHCDDTHEPQLLEAPRGELGCEREEARPRNHRQARLERIRFDDGHDRRQSVRGNDAVEQVARVKSPLRQHPWERDDLAQADGVRARSNMLVAATANDDGALRIELLRLQVGRRDYAWSRAPRDDEVEPCRIEIA